jgi:transcriptional regulator with XRE-family HTH domain
MAKRKPTSDAVEILRRRYVLPNPSVQEALHEERASFRIAQDIMELRSRLNLTQQKFAELVGTTASVICRLEDGDYEGHSMSMLERIAAAVEHKLELNIEFVAVKSVKPSTRKQAKAKLKKTRANA